MQENKYLKGWKRSKKKKRLANAHFGEKTDGEKQPEK